MKARIRTNSQPLAAGYAPVGGRNRPAPPLTPRCGVTLVELLAAMAIIVLLLSMLVPAMLKLRQSASNAGHYSPPASGAQPPSAFTVNRQGNNGSGADSSGQPQDQNPTPGPSPVAGAIPAP